VTQLEYLPHICSESGTEAERIGYKKRHDCDHEVKGLCHVPRSEDPDEIIQYSEISGCFLKKQMRTLSEANPFLAGLWAESVVFRIGIYEPDRNLHSQSDIKHHERYVLEWRPLKPILEHSQKLFQWRKVD
jgi:hypothetical protein